MEDVGVTPIFDPSSAAPVFRADNIVGFALRNQRTVDGRWNEYRYCDIEDDAGFCIVIGREGDFLTGEGPLIGRRHAAIEPDGAGRVGIVDNSKNGTQIQRGHDTIVLAKGSFFPLEHGDVIILAKEVYLTFEYRMGK